jgi:hypothetical protein
LSPYFFNLFMTEKYTIDQKTKVWADERKAQIEKTTDSLSLAKYNFLKINFLERMIEQTAYHSDHCNTCKINQKKLDEMVEMLPELTKHRVEKTYESKFLHIRDHFHKEHHYSYPGRYTAIYVLLIGLAGFSIGMIISLLLKKAFTSDIVLLGSGIGIAIGYIVGASMDKKRIKEKTVI